MTTLTKDCTSRMPKDYFDYSEEAEEEVSQGEKERKVVEFVYQENKLYACQIKFIDKYYCHPGLLMISWRAINFFFEVVELLFLSRFFSKQFCFQSK